MHILRTIEEVVAYHLRRLRGQSTQSEMADMLGIPLRTYNALENGQIPRPETRRIIAQKLGIGETELFLDPDLTKPPNAGAALEVLSEFVKKNLPKP